MMAMVEPTAESEIASPLMALATALSPALALRLASLALPSQFRFTDYCRNFTRRTARIEHRVSACRLRLLHQRYRSRHAATITPRPEFPSRSQAADLADFDGNLMAKRRLAKDDVYIARRSSILKILSAYDNAKLAKLIL